MRRFLKRLRAAPPVNAPAARAVRLVSRAMGTEPEFFIRHLPKVGVATSRLPNGRKLRLWSRGDDWVANQVFWRGWAGYEPEVSTLFWRLASTADVMFDVGAHVGFYSIVAALANPRSAVYAFEPFPATYERLRRNLLLNGTTNALAIQQAVGSTDGSAEFFHVPGIIPCSSSLSAEFMVDGPAVTSISVDVTRLDTFCREHGVSKIDLMKIDTETTEPAVLAGAGDLLGDSAPFIFCEVLPTADVDALGDVLAPYGYRYYLLTGSGPEPRDAIVADETCFNYLLAPRPLPA